MPTVFEVGFPQWALQLTAFHCCLSLVEGRSILIRRHLLPILQSDGWIIVYFQTQFAEKYDQCREFSLEIGPPLSCHCCHNIFKDETFSQWEWTPLMVFLFFLFDKKLFILTSRTCGCSQGPSHLETSHLTFFSWLHHLTIHLRGRWVDYFVMMTQCVIKNIQLCQWYQLREPRSHMNSSTIACL